MFGLLPAAMGQGQSANAGLPKNWAEKVTFRSIGPANMGGRITALTFYEKEPSTWWAATASGGLLKTVNNGVNFEHQFDKEATVSIGDVQVAQSDPNIVWVGTGESNPRNSVSWGDGVYKSFDGGKTWKNMGLNKTYQIGRIAVHPENPDIVYVGALGRLWGANEDRGLFKTVDGGNTWEKILFVDDLTGVIDVRLNPKNFDELIVATYERSRDGFDGNDPFKKYGAGSGIYRSTDAGKTFEKSTEGLPTCKLGRIGLDYYRKNPAFVYAIIESEQIAKEPETSAFAGLRAEDAEIGARLVDVTKDGPSDKAGLKIGDIVLNLGGHDVMTNQQLLAAVRRNKADDKVKVKYSRDKVLAEVEMTLTKKPPTRGQQNPFSGTLGGQAENLQDQQGDKGFENGGVYMSKNGGKSWERINSLNPRPMYYSQVRVDPINRNNLYVLGTSLYRSKDGGKIFTADGGSDGIHVDHHAMWIDPRDPKHMVLGNDGGIYVTWDRMDHWDHLSHVAIGQFYHVGVDTRRDYNVYGGLQDNGSWGGPSRSGRGSGPVNTDWFSVGGGDGFVTLVDPNDPDQIYFESQNGGNGRINLRTGERGFIRPRPPRGTTYRFDWKTPFILSPHNSKIFYSAGNHVFRSIKKGDEIKAISPEISNSSSGAGSAIAESPLQEGLIYVGTNDGAVWVTKDGGQKWEEIYFKKMELGRTSVSTQESETAGGAPTAEPAGRPAGEQPEGQPGGQQPAASNKPVLKKLNDQDAITGVWVAKPTGEAAGGDAGEFTIYLQWKEDGSMSGATHMRNRTTPIRLGKFAAESGDCSWETETPRIITTFSAKLVDGALVGSYQPGSDSKVEFKAEKQPDPNSSNSPPGLYSLASESPNVPRILNDKISGLWKGVAEDENLPGGRLEFEIELKADEKNEITGKVTSAMGVLKVFEGKFDPETKKLNFTGESEDITVEFNAVVEGAKITGELEARGTDSRISFSAEKQTATESPPETEKPATDAAPKMDEPVVAGTTSAETKQEPEKAADPETKKEEMAPATTAYDPVSGSWQGTFQAEQIPRGGSEFSLELKLGEEGKVTGSMNSQRGDTEISDGKFDAEKKSVEFVVDNGRFGMNFKGTVSGDKMTGDVDMGGGQFQMQFEANRTSKGPEVPAGSTTAAEKQTPKKLEELVPGPRWVSAIEASRFKAGRVYLTLDGHRSDDDEPYAFISEDFGATWASIRGNLPATAGSTRVIREDLRNENLLYLGSEFGAWVSIDRGINWTRLGGLPTVAVHDFAQHPTAGEIVAATHGRSLWVADVTFLRQISAETMASKAKLYRSNEVIRWRSEARHGDSGTRRFVGGNPGNSASIGYSISSNVQSVELTISDAMGAVIRRFEDVSMEPGLHIVEWDFRPTPTAAQRRGGAIGGRGGGGQAGGGRGGGGGGRRGGGLGGGSVIGTYLVTLRVDGEAQHQLLKVSADPDLPADATPQAMEEMQFEQDANSDEFDVEEFWRTLLDF
jgi:photosystem II stability/assembly factor-like uncharacterized protein